MGIEVQQDAENRRHNREARDYLFQKGAVGCRVSNERIKHRNVTLKDAKRGNLVVLDVRSAGNLDECVLGPWEKQYMIGLLKDRPKTKANNDPDDILEIQMYEPYYYDPNTRDTEVPMWAAFKQGKVSKNECSSWKYLLGVPWLPIKQLPLSVHHALREANQQYILMPDKKHISQNFMDCGLDVVKLPKTGYVDKQKASVIKYVMSLDASERPKKSSASAIILNEDTKDDLLSTIIGKVSL